MEAIIIDLPRNAFAHLRNQLLRFRRKQARPLVSSHLQPVIHEAARFFAGKRTQAADRRDSLPQLHQCRSRQFVRQPRLSHQNDL